MKDNRSEILAKANTPIGFFVLALLVVEMFIAAVVGISDFDADRKFTCLLIGVGLFVLDLGVVTAFTWFRPRNLTYSEASHLEESLQGTLYGSSAQPRSEGEVDALPSTEPPRQLEPADK